MTVMDKDFGMQAFRAYKGHVSQAAGCRRGDVAITVGDGLSPRTPDVAQAMKDMAGEARKLAVAALQRSKGLSESQAHAELLRSIGLAEGDAGVAAVGARTAPATLKVWALNKVGTAVDATLLREVPLFAAAAAGSDRGGQGVAAGGSAASATPDPTAVTALAVSEDGSTIAVGCADGRTVLLQGDFLRGRGVVEVATLPPPPTSSLPAAASATADAGAVEHTAASPHAVTFVGFAESVDATTVAQAFPKRSTMLEAFQARTGAQNAVQTLFVTTPHSVRNFTVGGTLPLHAKAACRDLGSESLARGAAPRCATVTPEGQLAVANEVGVFFFTPESSSSVAAVQGHKLGVSTFRRYLVLVLRGAYPRHTVWVYDMQNKLAALNMSLSAESGVASLIHRGSSGRLQRGGGHWGETQQGAGVTLEDVGGVHMVLPEWGRLHILTGAGVGVCLREHDTTSKLDTLFRLNRFDVAIQVASTTGYDASSIMDIFRAYGDHLHKKKAFGPAMEQFLVTIGYVEPSYVIRKYLDAPRIYELTRYLEVLHKKGHATDGHTTLLLNCYTKLRDTDKLRAFIRGEVTAAPPRLTPAVASVMEGLTLKPTAASGAGGGAAAAEGGESGTGPNFHVDAAIAVLKEAEFTDEALQLAGAQRKHEAFLQLLVDAAGGFTGGVLMASAAVRRDRHGATIVDPDAPPDPEQEAALQEDAALDTLFTALEYIERLPFFLAEKALLRHGKVLLDAWPERCRELVQELCVGFTPKTGLRGTTLGEYVQFPQDPAAAAAGDEAAGQASASTPRSNPEDFLPMFVEHPRQAKLLLRHVADRVPDLPTSVWNALLDLSLSAYDEDELLETSLDVGALPGHQESGKGPSAPLRAAGTGQLYEDHWNATQRRLKADVLDFILTNPAANFDPEQALILTRSHGYEEGTLVLLAQAKRYRELAAHHIAAATVAARRSDVGRTISCRQLLMETCQRHGGSDALLWVDALQYFVQAYGCDPPAVQQSADGVNSMEAMIETVRWAPQHRTMPNHTSRCLLPTDPA